MVRRGGVRGAAGAPGAGTAGTLAPAIVVFAKAPVAGRVKTRLAPDLGPSGAAALQEALILDTADVVLEAAAGLVPAPALFCAAAEPEDEPVLSAMLSPAFVVVPQGPGDLGVRLESVLHRLLGGHAGAVALGADCPDLGPGQVVSAVSALGRADAVLGPAEDGGCWAIGLARRCPGAFAGVPWSTGSVNLRIQERLAALGASVVELERLRDLDRFPDLLRWASCPGTGYERTRAWWRSAGLA